MTPINPAVAGLPEYARQDVVASDQYAQSIDPAQPGFVAPSNDYYMQGSGGTAAAASVEDFAALGIFSQLQLKSLAQLNLPQVELDALYGEIVRSAQSPQMAAQMLDNQLAVLTQHQYASSIVGAQPATTAVTASVEDFAALGIFSQEELAQLVQMNLPPEELGAIYQEAVLLIQQHPEGTALLQSQAPAYDAPISDEQLAMERATFEQQQALAQEQRLAQSNAAVGAQSGPPAWGPKWETKFRDMMEAQGLDSKTQMMVLASLREGGMDKATLKEVFEYYANSPEGKAELRVANDQILKTGKMQDLAMLGVAGTAVAAGGVLHAMGSSKAVFAKALERVAAGGGTNAGLATKALDEIKAGRPLTKAMRLDIERAMRVEAGAVNRALHPIAKTQLNSAARHVTPAIKLTGREALQYGLFQRRGDFTSDMAAARNAGKVTAPVTAADDAMRGAASATSAAKAGASGSKAGATAAKAAVSGIDDAVRGAGSVSSAASAAKTAGTLSKGAKVLGPAGLVLAAGFGVYGIKKTMEAEGGFGKESAKVTGSVTGGIAAGVAGAALTGMAIGAVGGPIGAGAGAIIGSVVGGIAGSKLGEEIGGFVHGLFD